MLDSESQLREAIEKMLQPVAAEAAPAEQEIRAPPVPAQPATGSSRKILRYQSSMLPKETSPTPAKDSMGMDMGPVYDEPAQPAAPSAHPDAPAAAQPSAHASD
jgi:hypothetical protein